MEYILLTVLDLPNRDQEMPWHTNNLEIARKFETFYKKKSKTPKEDIQDTPINTLKDQLEEFIKKYVVTNKYIWCKRVEHTGSIYEGLKINDGLEFDLMFVMHGGKQFEIKKIPERPGYAYLHQKKEQRRKTLFNKLLVKKESTNASTNIFILSPEKVISKFQSTVQKFLDQHKEDGVVKKLRRHGPAIQLDVTEGGSILYSVDLVPSYEIIDEGECF